MVLGHHRERASRRRGPLTIALRPILAAGAALATLTACAPADHAAPASPPASSVALSPATTPSAHHTVTSPSPTPPAAPATPGGSAATALASLPVKGRAPKTGYARSQFGQRWADTDRNGCDTRNDILNRDLVTVTHKPGTHDCVVTAGTLRDPYTGTTIAFTKGQRTSTHVQIDHVVALSDAWQKGAQQIGARNRLLLANDPLNLLAVDGPANESKGDGDAATWLPSNKAFRCSYVARQVAVKRRYRLWVTPAERDAIAAVLSRCPGQPLPTSAAPEVTWTSRPSAPRTSSRPSQRRPTTGTSHTSTPRHAHTSATGSRHGNSTTAREPAVVHGGSFCSEPGAHAATAKGTVLTCRTAKDGRLRWKR